MGWLGGVGSGLAGAGAAAGTYRDKVYDIWQQNKRAASDHLAQLIANEEDPERRTELINHLYDVNSLKVGHDPSKAIKAIQESFIPHPVVSQLVKGGGQPAPPQTPTPALPGQTPGTATRPADGLSSLIAPQQQQPPPASALSNLAGSGPINIQQNADGSGAAGRGMLPQPQPPPRERVQSVFKPMAVGDNTPPGEQPATSPVQPVRQQGVTATPPI